MKERTIIATDDFLYGLEFFFLVGRVLRIHKIQFECEMLILSCDIEKYTKALDKQLSTEFSAFICVDRLMFVHVQESQIPTVHSTNEYIMFVCLFVYASQINSKCSYTARINRILEIRKHFQRLNVANMLLKKSKNPADKIEKSSNANESE